jgi:hypothetical protein
MFVHTWNKYLPIIKILLKRSVQAEQTLEMNSTDFHRAAAGRKVKYSFSFLLVNGKLGGFEVTPPLAKDLITALQQDSVTDTFIRRSHLQFTLTNNFKLAIRNVTPPVEAEAAEPENEEVMENDAATVDGASDDK